MVVLVLSEAPPPLNKDLLCVSNFCNTLWADLPYVEREKQLKIAPVTHGTADSCLKLQRCLLGMTACALFGNGKFRHL